MFVMADIVANHVAPINFDYSQIYPFNTEDFYHDF